MVVYGYSHSIEQHVIIKYDTDGNLLWQISVDVDGLDNIESIDLEGYVDQPPMPIGYGNCTNNMTQISSDEDPRFKMCDICLDDDDNIIFVCRLVEQIEPPQQTYVVVFKYDQNGNELWKNKYDYNDLLEPGYDIVIDTDSSIFIPCTNYIWSFLLKLNPEGSFEWIKPIKIIPFWWALSVVLDSNENPIVSAIYCAIDPLDPTMPIAITKFSNSFGNKLVDGVLEIPLRGTTFPDAALAIDTSDGSVFFGFIDKFYKINPSLSTITWQKEYTYPIFDLVLSNEKLIACGGWCTVNDDLNYYAAVYNKNSGNKLLDMVLGELLYCEDPFFQGHHNHLKGMSIDNNGDVLFAGGKGGIRIMKVRITNTGIPNKDLSNIEIMEEPIEQME